MSGKLMIGVARMPPMLPALVIVNVLPRSSSGFTLPSRVRLATSCSSAETCRHALRLDVLDHRNDQAVGRVGRDTDVDERRVDQLAGFLVRGDR